MQIFFGVAAATALTVAAAIAERTRAVDARDEFLAIASHELRTPLTALLLHVQNQLRHVRSGVDALPGAAIQQLESTLFGVESDRNKLLAEVNELSERQRNDQNKLHAQFEALQARTAMAEKLLGNTRQLHVTITVPHAADVTAALTAATDVVTRNERVLKDPAPQVGIAQIADTGIRIGIHPWVRVPDVGAAEAELNRSLVEQFRGRGVGLGAGPADVRLVNGAVAAGAR